MSFLIDIETIAPRLRIKTVGKTQKVFDPIRKKFVVLTPEEFVRQIFIIYLIDERGFPIGLIQIEKEIKVNGLSRRFDILVYNKTGKPILLVECKNVTVLLNDNVLEQTINYNLSLKVPYVVITNGISSFAFEINFESKLGTVLSEIPHWQALQ